MIASDFERCTTHKGGASPVSAPSAPHLADEDVEAGLVVQLRSAFEQKIVFFEPRRPVLLDAAVVGTKG